MTEAHIEFVAVSELKHIEGFSQKRVAWLREKILGEAMWTAPLVIDDRHALVMDGQHRMEVALAEGLRVVPAVRFRYADVEIWSLRPKAYQFDWKEVERRALVDDIYPYKTVKHRFPATLPTCSISIDELM